MDAESIVITLDYQEVCIPEKVVFKTLFKLKNSLTLNNGLAQAQQQFLHFAAANNLDYGEAQSASLEVDEVEYSCPSYLITLTQPMYLLLEKYRDEHPELTGFVVNKTFTKKDQDRFLVNLGNRARQMAEKKAQQRDLILGDVLEIEEIKLEQKGWVVYPPLSARYNHFQQVLAGQYILVFSVQTYLK